MCIRVLIADDQPDVVEALRLLLKGAGYQSEAVMSPAASRTAGDGSSWHSSAEVRIDASGLRMPCVIAPVISPMTASVSPFANRNEMSVRTGASAPGYANVTLLNSRDGSLLGHAAGCSGGRIASSALSTSWMRSAQTEARGTIIETKVAIMTDIKINTRYVRKAINAPICILPSPMRWAPTLTAGSATDRSRSSSAARSGSSVPAADIEKQKEIFAEQLKQEGKPEVAWPKIIEGKVNKWYTELCVVDQDSVIENGKSVDQVRAEAAQQAGGSITLLGFVRFQLGEGLSRAEEDFAEEAKKMAGA